MTSVRKQLVDLLELERDYLLKKKQIVAEAQRQLEVSWEMCRKREIERLEREIAEAKLRRGLRVDDDRAKKIEDLQRRIAEKKLAKMNAFEERNRAEQKKLDERDAKRREIFMSDPVIRKRVATLLIRIERGEISLAGLDVQKYGIEIVKLVRHYVMKEVAKKLKVARDEKIRSMLVQIESMSLTSRCKSDIKSILEDMLAGRLDLVSLDVEKYAPAAELYVRMSLCNLF